MAARVRQLCAGCSLVVVPPTEEARGLVPRECEVMLVALGHGVATLAFAVSLLPEQPWLHPVFVSDGGLCPEAEALRCLGSKYVLPASQLWSWLALAIGPLSAHARALRSLAEAERAIPPPPASPLVPEPALPLPQAEQRFRETYLRVVLARAQSQKAAALVAGVPYTTLRSMVEKLLL